MNIGFIGAGKVGFSMGKYLSERGVKVTGYYSRNPQSSMEAANFTNTRQYLKMRHLVEDSDAIFLTVPDGAIDNVWEQLKMLPIQNKIISHLSGSVSSKVFQGIDRYHAYGYSIHPLFAINDKYNSYKELSHAFFTIEGDDKYLNQLLLMFQGFGNSVAVISAENKLKYHAAAAVVSNLYIGLAYTGEKLLRECGFSPENAHQALAPLILGNAENLVAYGAQDALTGPIERNDVETVSDHIGILDGLELEIYKSLSKQVLEVAKSKHSGRDYEKMEELLQ